MHVSKDHSLLGHGISGNPIGMTSFRLSAKTAGKRVYIQSGIHGGEITYWLQHRLFNFLKENMTSGEVVLVPFASPVSWEQRSYFYTHGKFDLYDGRDFNSHFPGDAGGNLHQRASLHLFSLARDCDLALDLHTARDSIPYGIYSRADYAPLLRTLGLEYNFLDVGDTPGSLDAALDSAGVENICIECGSHDEYDAAKLDTVFAGILRLLARLDIVGREFSAPAGKTGFFFTRHKKIIAQESGFVRHGLAPGDPFRKGDTLFTLYRTAELGSELQEIAAEGGVAYKFAPTHIHRVGDDVLHYIPRDELKPL